MQCLCCIRGRQKEAHTLNSASSSNARPDPARDRVRDPARDSDVTNESTAITAVNTDTTIHEQEGNQRVNQPQQDDVVNEPRLVAPVHAENDPQPQASPPSVSEKMWDTAYDGVKEADPSLVRSYEKIISLELGRDDGDGTSEIQADNAVENVVESGDPSRRRQQMALFVKRRQDSASGRAGALKVTLQGIGILQKFKLEIASALQTYPPAGLAFAGVCLVAEVC